MLNQETIFLDAELPMVPEDQAQRQAFEALLPHIIRLRERGFSFPQITTVLNDSGLHLQPSAVRTYYDEMIARMIDIGQQRMNEAICLLSEIRREISGNLSASTVATVPLNTNTIHAELWVDKDVKDHAPPRFCKTIKAGVPPIQRRDTVDPAVYLTGDMEHPAIPSLILSLEQRLYGAALEYVDFEGGEIRQETPEEKRFRVTWRRPIPMTKTRTGHTFVEMDLSLFPSIKTRSTY